MQLFFKVICKQMFNHILSSSSIPVTIFTGLRSYKENLWLGGGGGGSAANPTLGQGEGGSVVRV